MELLNCLQKNLTYSYTARKIKGTSVISAICFLTRRIAKQETRIEKSAIIMDRKMTDELVAPLAYEINEIVVSYESRLSTVRQTEETNRQLMTSLSHDIS